VSAGATKSKKMGDLPQWVCWRAELREGKATKIPYSPKSGTRARCGDPLTWGTLPEARKAARSPGALRLLRGLPWREVLQPGFPRRLGACGRSCAATWRVGGWRGLSLGANMEIESRL
jgi:hypothetical protein